MNRIWEWLKSPAYAYYATDWPENFGWKKGPSRLEIIIVGTICIIGFFFITRQILGSIA